MQSYHKLGSIYTAMNIQQWLPDKILILKIIFIITNYGKGMMELSSWDFVKKGRKEGREEDWFPKTVFLSQFLYTKEK